MTQLTVYLVQRLSVCTLNSLYHKVAVYEVRAYPGWVEHCLSIVQEHYTNYVVTNVTLFIDLWVCKREERERERLNNIILVVCYSVHSVTIDHRHSLSV